MAQYEPSCYLLSLSLVDKVSYVFLPLCYVSWQEVTHPPPTTFTTKKCGWTYSKKLLLHKMHDCKEKEEKKNNDKRITFI